MHRHLHPLLFLCCSIYFGGSLRAQSTTPPPALHAAAHANVPLNPLNPAPPAQPIPYSHKLHLAMGLQCQFCHVNPEPGNLMTFPATSVCMSCHQNIGKTKPALAKLADYAKSGEPIPWVRVYTLLPGPRWSHRTHLQAGTRCENCHGQVSKMDRMSEVTSVTTMYSCLICHQANQAKTSCSTCHSWPPPDAKSKGE